MKRFTETDKWLDPWFRSLPVEYKTLWLFLQDRCDNAGVVIVDLDLFKMLSGAKVSKPEAIRQFEGQITLLSDTKWILNEFIEFQYGQLSENCVPHKKIMSIIQKHCLMIKDLRLYPSPTLPYPSPRVPPTLQEEDKDKDKEEEQKGECEGKGLKANGWHPSELQLRVGSWFGRKPTTNWGAGELKAWQSVKHTPEDEIQLLENYYTGDMPRDQDYRRRDLSTLLNNWTSEIDRARKNRPKLENRGF